MIRPRRFGKSLFLNMLDAYYDIERRHEFDELFGDKHVGKYPTRERNTYMVLRFNFSEVRPDPETLAESFDEYCNWRYLEFAQRYAKYFEEGFEQNVQALSTTDSKLDYIATRAKVLGLSIYLMIDEYGGRGSQGFRSRRPVTPLLGRPAGGIDPGRHYFTPYLTRLAGLGDSENGRG